MRRWLARLAFSLIVLGAVLVYEGYRATTSAVRAVSNARVTLYFVAGAAALLLGGFGLRERHRPPRDRDDEVG